MNNEINNGVLQPEQVVMGPMNGPEDPHPATIRSICRLLGVPLPKDAVCGNQPSKYMKRGILPGTPEFIRDALGQFMPDIDEEEFAKLLRIFKRKYKSQNCLKFTRNDLTVYFCDWLLYCRDRGFTHNCYFDYELYNKEADIRETFLNEGFRNRIYQVCRTKNYGKYLLDKAVFNETFKKYVKRDWIDTSDCTYEEFLAFCEKHERFFAKPVRGTGGAGARVIERDSETREKLFEICQNESLILEDIVKQHPSLAEFNAGSVNTTRVITLMCADNVPRVMFSVVRFGRSGIVVDNFHGGGVGAIIDPDTGKIISHAINRVHDKVVEHPDTHKQFFGFQYPEWEKVKAAVLDAHTMIPQMRNIGWDVTVTSDGDVEFIEGNGKPNNHLPQAPDQTGRRDRYAVYLKEIEELKGVHVEELPPVELIDYDAPLRDKKKTTKKSKSSVVKGEKPAAAKKTEVAPAKAKEPISFVKRVKRFIKRKLGR